MVVQGQKGQLWSSGCRKYTECRGPKAEARGENGAGHVRKVGEEAQGQPHP